MRGSVRQVAAAALLGALVAAGRTGAEPSLEARATAALLAGAAAPNAAAAAAAFDRAAAIAEIAAPARVLAARAWLDARQPADAEASVRRALALPVGPPWEADLHDALARARDEQGDAPGAQRAWLAALARGLSPERAPEVRLALAERFLASGDVDGAARELRAAWIDAAGGAPADRAGERLADLERRHARSLGAANDWIERADALFAAQRTQAAQGAYEQALARGASGPSRVHAARRRADCLFRSRRYDEAAAAFAALAPDPEARVWHARSLARADRVDAALAAFESIGADAPRATAAWARFLAGTLQQGRGRKDEARVLFAAAAADGDPKVAADALWRLGFGAYRDRDFDTARRHLEALAVRQTDPIERLGARYWAARARRALAGEAEPADAALAAIASEYPLSYYGARAAALVPVASLPAPREQAPATLGERDLFAARVLAAAGFRGEAQRALAPLAERAANLADRVAVARIYADAGDAHRAQLLLARNDAETLARGPGGGSDDEPWRLAWPDAFASERRAARTPGSRLDPWLVVALMREESGYRPDAVSVAGALGLLQLMPDTARRLAGAAGLAELTPARIFEPALNIRLGTLFLEQLAARFDGRTEAIAAAYNAGPGPVASWRATPIADDAEWIETIPYDETRGYVKRILRSMHVYRMLHP